MKTKQLPIVSAPHIPVDDRVIPFAQVDGQWLIAIKPICEALEIKYEHHFESLKTHPVFGQLFRNHGMVAADRKTRMMVCLPERYIYGWLLQLRSKNTKLIAFQLKCYDVLFDHFHGVVTGRAEAIRERALAQREMEQLRKELQNDERYKRLQELHGVVLHRSKELKEADRAVEREQLTLFAEPSLN